MADPTSVTGLVNRWRADSIGQANASAVSSWPALVGGVALTQATTANQPTYQTAGVGGQAAVKFVTATSQYLVSATTIAVAQPFTAFIVHQLARTDTTVQQLWDGNNVQIITLTAGYDCFAGTDVTGGTMSLNPSVITFTGNSTTSYAAQDGTAFSGTSAGTGAPAATWQVGRKVNATQYLDGSIAEMLVYNTALSATDRATVHSYVQDYYGITVAGYVSSARRSRPLIRSQAVNRAGNF